MQKTAYELRISDWSSYVCSSDLEGRHLVVVVGGDAIVVGLELHLAVGGPARARTLASPDATAGGDALGGAEIEVAGNEVAHHCSPGCMSMPDSYVDLNAKDRKSVV